MNNTVLDDSYYQCERCLFKTKHKSTFITHLNKKIPCKVINNNISIEEIYEKHLFLLTLDVYNCFRCDKSFGSKAYRNQHLKCCKALPETLTNLPEEHLRDLRKLSPSELLELLKEYNEFIELKGVNTFGEEDVSYITPEYAASLYESCERGIVFMICMIYFNNQQPENVNTKMQSLRGHTVDVVEDRKWVTKDSSFVINTMINRSRDLIIELAYPVLEARGYPLLLENKNKLQNYTSKTKQFLRKFIISLLVKRHKRWNNK